MLQSKPKPLQARNDWRQQNLSCPRWGLLKKDTLYPSSLVEPSRFAPAAAEHLPLSSDCLQNQASASMAFPSKDVDLSESAWSACSGAKSRASHVSWQTCLFCKSGNKNDWAFRTRLLAQPQRSGSAHLPPTPSSCRFASNGLFFGAHALLFHRRFYQWFQMRGISGFKCVGQSTWWTLLHAFNTTQNVIQSCKQPSKWWTHTEEHMWRIRRQYCSLMAPELVPFLPRRWTDTMLRADVLLH